MHDAAAMGLHGQQVTKNGLWFMSLLSVKL